MLGILIAEPLDGSIRTESAPWSKGTAFDEEEKMWGVTLVSSVGTMLNRGQFKQQSSLSQKAYHFTNLVIVRIWYS